MDIRIISKDGEGLLCVGDRDIKVYGSAIILIEGNDKESITTVGVYKDKEEATDKLDRIIEEIMEAIKNGENSIVINAMQY